MVKRILSTVGVFAASVVLAFTLMPRKVSTQAGQLVFGSSSGTAQVIKSTSNALWVSIQGFADGTFSAPSISFVSDPDTGFYSGGANILCLSTGGGVLWCGGTNLTLQSGSALTWATSATSPLSTSDIYMRRSAAKTLTIDTDGADGLLTLVRIDSPVAIGPIGSGYSASSALRFSNNTGLGWRNAANSGDYSVYIDNNNLFQVQAASNITAGTDVTTTNAGDVSRFRYQATITPASGGAANCATQAAGFKAAALTADCVIATIPAGQKIIAAYADVTVGFTCSGTCTGTKVFTAGSSAGGTQLFAASLNVVATGQFGLADADMGSSMTRAAAIQGGWLNSWSGVTTITARFTSGTGNWGNAAATFVNAGSIKFTIVTEQEK